MQIWEVEGTQSTFNQHIRCRFVFGHKKKYFWGHSSPESKISNPQISCNMEVGGELKTKTTQRVFAFFEELGSCSISWKPKKL